MIADKESETESGQTVESQVNKTNARGFECEQVTDNYQPTFG